MELLPHILRSIVSAAMFALLLVTLGQPRVNKKWIYFSIAGAISLDVLTSVFFYMDGNLTQLAKFDILFYALIGVAIKPLFKDTVMQWVFNFITDMNVFFAVVIVSYLLSHYLPFPSYANTVLRLLLFGGVILLFRRLRGIYRRVVKQWQVFAALVLTIGLNFGYYIAASEDIEKTLIEQADPLVLLVILAAAIYVCIFYSLQKIASEYELRNENLTMQNQQDILNLSMAAMSQRLSLMDELERQGNVARHDRRHFNNTLLELIKSGQTDAAVGILERQSALTPPAATRFCENAAVNAAVTYYASLAEQAGVRLDAALDIPETLHIDALELAIVVSNLLENAIHAAAPVPNAAIRFTAVYTGQLLVEMENSYVGAVKTDENGYPVSEQENHGVGTKSVVAFCEKQGAAIEYEIGKRLFKVRLIV